MWLLAVSPHRPLWPALEDLLFELHHRLQFACKTMPRAKGGEINWPATYALWALLVGALSGSADGVITALAFLPSWSSGSARGGCCASKTRSSRRRTPRVSSSRDTSARTS